MSSHYFYPFFKIRAKWVVLGLVFECLIPLYRYTSAHTLFYCVKTLCQAKIINDKQKIQLYTQGVTRRDIPIANLTVNQWGFLLGNPLGIPLGIPYM